MLKLYFDYKVKILSETNIEREKERESARIKWNKKKIEINDYTILAYAYTILLLHVHTFFLT